MDLQELSEWMKERNLKGHWEHSEWSQKVQPHLWKGGEIMQALQWSGELITTGEAGRRTIQMRNPGLAAGMTNTVHISVQLASLSRVHRRPIRSSKVSAFRCSRATSLRRRTGLGTTISTIPPSRSCGSMVWMSA